MLNIFSPQQRGISVTPKICWKCSPRENRDTHSFIEFKPLPANVQRFSPIPLGDLCFIWSQITRKRHKGKREGEIKTEEISILLQIFALHLRIWRSLNIPSLSRSELIWLLFPMWMPMMNRVMVFHFWTPTLEASSLSLSLPKLLLLPRPKTRLTTKNRWMMRRNREEEEGGERSA